MKKIAWSVALVAAVVGCKQRVDHQSSSEVLSETPLNSTPIDLTSYKAAGPLLQTEVNAIRLYSQEVKIPALGNKNWYTAINTALRDDDRSTISSQAANILNVVSGANKLRNGPCTARRFVDLPFSVASAIDEVGETYTDKAFASSTRLTAPPPAFAKRGEVMIIESQNCPMIESYSSIPSEREVLFPPGTDFEVTRDSNVVAIGGRNYTAYYLKETRTATKAKVIAVDVAGAKDDADATFDASKFVGRTYTGRDGRGKRRSVTFTTEGTASYTGAAGKLTSATWSLTGNQIELVTPSASLWYQVSTQDKICFQGESQNADVTSSCLVFDDGASAGNGDGAAPAAGGVAEPADASITFRDFFDQQFDEEGTNRLHLKFLTNKEMWYYTNGQAKWNTSTWAFYDSPARISAVIGKVTFWFHVVDRSKICKTGTSYPGNLQKCYVKK